MTQDTAVSIIGSQINRAACKGWMENKGLGSLPSAATKRDRKVTAIKSEVSTGVMFECITGICNCNLFLGYSLHVPPKVSGLHIRPVMWNRSNNAALCGQQGKAASSGQVCSLWRYVDHKVLDQWTIVKHIPFLFVISWAFDTLFKRCEEILRNDIAPTEQDWLIRKKYIYYQKEITAEDLNNQECRQKLTYCALQI